METKTIDINGREFTYRGLYRKEIKQFRKNGINFNRIPMADLDDVMDQVFDVVLSPENIGFIDSLSNKEAFFDYCTPIWKAVMIETYGDPDAEKNLSKPGSGDPTETGSTTAGHAN